MLDLDPTTITDLDGAREAIRRLLNMVETLSADLSTAQKEIQRLRDENARLKGEQGKPDIKPNKPPDPPADHSSEQQRRVPRGRVKRRTNESITIDREVTLEADPATLPDDAEFKGYEAVTVQDITLQTDNVRFYKAKWYSPGQRKTFLTPLPQGYHGQFGPQLRSLVWTLHFACQMSEKKIVELLHSIGIQISAGQVSNMLIHGHDALHEEKAAIVDAGLAASPWQQTDDTSTRVNGQNHHCHVLCNDLFTSYTTLPRKDRLSVLSVLLNGRALTFLVNDESLAFLEQPKLSSKILAGVREMPRGEAVDEATFATWLDTYVPTAGPQQQRRIREATAVAAYHAQQAVPVIEVLVCDDAPQFKLLTAELALCWVHDGRHYHKELQPRVRLHQQLLADFKTRYWMFYHALLAYRAAPMAEDAAALEARFDELFSTVTGYDALDARIAKTRAKKASLLLVLTYPELPLHNNAAELACRARVRKRDVSFGPRTEAGAKMWDTGMTLVETAKKVGVSIYHYMHDRLSGALTMPSLASEVARLAADLRQCAAPG
jgi:hypothetical protein